MSAPLIHLICGSTGAGKTTYADALADQLCGVRFSIDEWMTALFWMDTPKPLDPAWSLSRVERCSAQIWRTAQRVSARGVPCILDLGFSRAEQRALFGRQARDAGLGLKLHYLDIPEEERWRRVQGRNKARGDSDQLPFDVTREMFDFVETLFEPPSPAELSAASGLHIQSASKGS